jgi:hypothetical protein
VKVTFKTPFTLQETIWLVFLLATKIPLRTGDLQAVVGFVRCFVAVVGCGGSHIAATT